MVVRVHTTPEYQDLAYDMVNVFVIVICKKNKTKMHKFESTHHVFKFYMLKKRCAKVVSMLAEGVNYIWKQSSKFGFLAYSYMIISHETTTTYFVFY